MMDMVPHRVRGLKFYTLVEQSFKDKGDREELIDIKVVGVSSTESHLRPNKTLTLERIDRYSWNKV